MAKHLPSFAMYARRTASGSIELRMGSGGCVSCPPTSPDEMRKVVAALEAFPAIENKDCIMLRAEIAVRKFAVMRTNTGGFSGNVLGVLLFEEVFRLLDAGTLKEGVGKVLKRHHLSEE